MDTKDIDKTHIIALRETDGMFRNTEIPIDRPEQFIAELKAMIDNPNRSVWDMQSHFSTRFPKSESYLDYIYPYSYNSSYVGGIRYPQMKGYDELRKSWSEAGDAARRSYLTSCEQNGKPSDNNEAIRVETTAINDLKKRQKQNFFGEAMRWIDAICYNEAASQLNRNRSVKMYSKENIGWSNFTH